MSGFRKIFVCANLLTHFIESAKRALDDQTYVGSVMTDILRALSTAPVTIVQMTCIWSARGVLQVTEQLFCE